MKSYRVVVSKVIKARPEHLYRIVSDTEQHRQILPKEFERFEVDGGTHLELQSEFRSKPGFAGFIERLLSPNVIRGLYRRELDLLDTYARK